MVRKSETAFQTSPLRTIKHSSYFAVYDHLFAKFQDKPITFLEIGVLGGGSLHAWRQFFGDKAKIIGVDLNPEIRKFEEDGFEIVIGDQASKELWDELGRKYPEIDVILDDGGHRYLQQIRTVNYGAPLIKDGGYLVIEDTHTSYKSGFGPRDLSLVNFAKVGADALSARHVSMNGQPETRFWSIQFFDGIVAYHVNSTESKKKSRPVSNDTDDTFVLDHRNQNVPVVGKFEILASRFKFLGKIPGAVHLYRLMRDFLYKIFSQEKIERESLKHEFGQRN